MRCLWIALLLLAHVAVAHAGPARPIRSNNFQFNTPCGPAWDVFAQKGQWFAALDGTTNALSWEFHDDNQSPSIAGVVQNIQYAPPGTSNSNIMAFDVLATVFNNLSGEPPVGTSSNSHYEVQAPAVPVYQGTMMFDTRITAEFAIADPSLVPTGAPPYWTDPVSGGAYFIEALNEHERAWYCWTPGESNPQFQPSGHFQVPAWKLGDIPPGGSIQVMMQFKVTGGGMPASDYRHSVIRASQWLGKDLLYCRHNSLKISHWLDTLLIDDGSIIHAPPGQYEGEPPEYVYASDASVFFNPTPPGEMAMLHIDPVSTNQSPDAVVLSWDALDAIDYQIQYSDDLSTNLWTLVAGPGIPPVIPSPMVWIDDGAIITNLPVQQQPQRFYRLVEP